MYKAKVTAFIINIQDYNMYNDNRMTYQLQLLMQSNKLYQYDRNIDKQFSTFVEQ